MADYITYAYLYAKSYWPGLTDEEYWKFLNVRLKLGFSLTDEECWKLLSVRLRLGL